MDAFLKILGGIALTLVVVIGIIAAGLWILLRVAIGRVKKLAKAMGGPVAPIEIQLAHLDGAVPPAVERLAAELERQGFQRIDAYGVIGIPNYELVALTKRDDDVYATAATHPMIGPHVDLFQSSPDGRSLTVTSSKEVSPPPPIAVRTVVRRTGASVETLLSEFRMARLTGEVNPTPTEGFAPAFEAEYRRVMEFQYRQGPLKDVDVDELTKLSGMEADPKTLAYLNELRRAEPDREEVLRNAFLDSGRVTAAQWEAMRDEVIFIHDHLDDDDLAETIYSSMDEPIEEDDILEGLRRASGATPREKFRSALAQMKLTERFELVDSMTTPEPYDVYRPRSE